MELTNKFSKDFFEQPRPETPKNNLKKLKPFKFSNDKKVLSGKYKNSKLITLPKKQK